MNDRHRQPSIGDPPSHDRHMIQAWERIATALEKIADAIAAPPRVGKVEIPKVPDGTGAPLTVDDRRAS